MRPVLTRGIRGLACSALCGCATVRLTGLCSWLRRLEHRSLGEDWRHYDSQTVLWLEIQANRCRQWRKQSRWLGQYDPAGPGGIRAVIPPIVERAAPPWREEAQAACQRSRLLADKCGHSLGKVCNNANLIRDSTRDRALHEGQAATSIHQRAPIGSGAQEVAADAGRRAASRAGSASSQLARPQVMRETATTIPPRNPPMCSR